MRRRSFPTLGRTWSIAATRCRIGQITPALSILTSFSARITCSTSTQVTPRMASSFMTVARLWCRSHIVRGVVSVSLSERHMSKARVIRLLAVAAVLGVLVALAVRELRIDRCLDNGGRWNYDHRVCEK
jgi:hypothetical protein